MSREPDALEQRSRVGASASAPHERRRAESEPGDHVLGSSSTGSMRTSWNVRATPSRAMRCAGSAGISASSKRDLPASGRSAPEIRLSTVVLPEPFGPIRPKISPRRDGEAEIRRPRPGRRRPCAPSRRTGRHAAARSAACDRSTRRCSAQTADARCVPQWRYRGNQPITPCGST